MAAKLVKSRLTIRKRYFAGWRKYTFSSWIQVVRSKKLSLPRALLELAGAMASNIHAADAEKC